MMDSTPTPEQIRELLNGIVDPCSAAAGAPGGLTDMGLVRSVEVQPGPDGVTVRVALGITEPGCMMSYPFQASARERLETLPGVVNIEVTLDTTLEWTEAELSPEYAARLADVRRAKRARLRRVMSVTRGRD
jgi:metal-sulfur cluster biosynthetic enzyme